MHGLLDLLTGLATIATTFALGNAYSHHDEPRIRLYGGVAIAAIAVTAAGRVINGASVPSAWVTVAAACFGVAFAAWHAVRQRSTSR